MRILHLAYEDPQQPGSGGGAIRTREINRRLGVRHEITVVVAGYPGAATRVEDNVRWVPIGARTGTKLDRLTYFALLGRQVAVQQYDLVVEDFGAPFSVGLSPLYTRAPIVASVQWLFAAQMRSKYHLPFDWIERRGLRFYDDFIVVSDWVATTLRTWRPGAVSETIPNGVEEAAFATEPRQPAHLLYVGRLDIEHKGVDLLLEIVAQVRSRLGDRMPPVLIAGDGPDRGELQRRVARGGLSRTIKFLGRIEGWEKYRLMASAYGVLMPSRFETFGMVAVESQAAGAPVVAFDVGPLAEVAGGGGARLVRPFDLAAFAREVAALVEEPALFQGVRHSGRYWAKGYDWDTIAKQQEAHYLRALTRSHTG